MQTKEAHFNSGAWLIEIRVSFLVSGLRFKSGQCGSNAVWNRWSYVLSSVTWGFITKTTTLIGTFAEEPIEGESWRLTKVQLTRLPLRCSLLKATDKTHYTAAASWNATPSIDQMAPSPSSTVPSHNHYISLWRGGAGVYVTHSENYVINFHSNIFIGLLFLKCTIYPTLLRRFSFKWENTLGRKFLNQNFQDNMKQEMEST